MSDDRKNQKHKASMQKQKEKVDARIEEASEQRGVAILLTGDGKGKSSSAFGMVLRALGYEQKVGVVQFIKGVQLSGEEIYLKEKCPHVDFIKWARVLPGIRRIDRQTLKPAERTWKEASRMLQDDSLDLVVLDELTYMLAYKYLDEDMVIDAIRSRPFEQSVVVTGRGGGSALRDVVDTVSEVKDIKHAFKAGVMARKGVDY